MATSITTGNPIDINAVIEFIQRDAAFLDCERIRMVAEETAFMRLPAAMDAITVGDTVELRNISPAAYKGLTGVITGVDGDRLLVRLDAASTKSLYFSRSRSKKINIASPNAEYVTRVPRGCCVPVAG